MVWVGHAIYVVDEDIHKLEGRSGSRLIWWLPSQKPQVPSLDHYKKFVNSDYQKEIQGTIKIEMMRYTNIIHYQNYTNYRTITTMRLQLCHYALTDDNNKTTRVNRDSGWLETLVDKDKIKTLLCFLTARYIWMSMGKILSLELSKDFEY